MCLHLRHRPGDANSSNGWLDAMETVLAQLPKGMHPFLNRADISFVSEESLTWHESVEDRPRYLFKLKKTARVMEALSSIKEEEWEGETGFGVAQVAEREIQLHGWTKKRRVVLSRKLIERESPQESGTLFGVCRYEYGANITNLDATYANAWQIVILYNQRCDSENIFDELKNQWGLNGFCSQNGNVTEFAARMTILSYNLWSMFVRFFNLTKHEEALCSRKEFLLIASSLTRSGRETMLKMATSDKLWKRIKEGYQRLLLCLKQTAPQLKLEGRSNAWPIALGNALAAP